MPANSKFADIKIPQVDIWTFLFERSTEFPENKTIYTDPLRQRSYSYASIKSSAIELGKGLKEIFDWKKDEVLLLYTPNSIDTPIITWGTHWAGGILTPSNPAYTAKELAFQLKDSGATTIVTQKEFLREAHAAARLAGICDDRIIIINDIDETGKFRHFTDICRIGASQGSKHRRAILTNPKTDLAFIVYSSGTTGHPKGVMLSHENVISNVLMLKAGEGFNLSWHGGFNNHGDRILGFLPFYHIYGLTSLVHQAIFNGIELIVMSKYELAQFCTLIQRYKITMAYVVPPVLLQLAKDPVVSNFDLSSVRLMSSGAAPLTRELVESVYQRLKIPVKQAYGLSETSPTTHSQPWDTWYTHIGSVGQLLANQQIKYMSLEKEELPIGEIGEIWIKGPNIFQGYLNNPEGTMNALTKDGYFKTGDVGYQDEHGHMYITDRLKELIKYKGFQIAPAELEGLLLSHPDIKDAAVIGVYKADRATEIPMAFVVLAEGITRDSAKEMELSKWLDKRVSNHKRLRGGIRWIEEVPKSPSGKILRKILRLQIQEEHAYKSKL